MDLNNLQKLRREKNIMQTTIAKYLNISPASYSQYENGRRTPSLEILYKLCQFYEVDMETLLGLQKPTPAAAHGESSGSAPNAETASRNVPASAEIPALSESGTEIDYIIYKHGSGEPLTDREIGLLVSCSRQSEAASRRLRQLEYFERLRRLYSHLNESGQQEAVKRIEELTELPRYTRKENPERD